MTTTSCPGSSSTASRGLARDGDDADPRAPRQAEYESNERAEGGSLTPLGRRQSQALAASLAGAGVAHVYTSTLARAVQTAEIVAARLGVGVTTRLGLREFDAGYLVERPLELDPVLAVYDRWTAGDLVARIPDGESATEVMTRLGAVDVRVQDAERVAVRWGP